MNDQVLTRPRTITWIRLITFVGLTVVAMILSSRIAIPLPFTPVPVTGQVFVVVLSGLLLGMGASAAQGGFLVLVSSFGMSAASGSTGTAALLGPTGGYIISFPLAVLLIGAISERSSSWITMCLASLAGLALIYAIGGGWLALQTHSIGKAFFLGVAPFILVDLAKCALAITIVYPYRSRVHRWLEGGVL